MLVVRKNAAPDFRDVAHFQQYLTVERKDRMSLLPPPSSSSSSPSPSVALLAPAHTPAISTNGTEVTVTVLAGQGSSSFVFDKSRGYLMRWTVDTDQGPLALLAADTESPTSAPALVLGFWRAPTDNDRPHALPYWQRFGVDVLRLHRLLRFSVETDTQASAGRTTVVECETVIAPPVLGSGWRSHATYTIHHASGALHVRVRLAPFGSGPAHVPRIGLDLRAHKSLQHVRWYGKGPGESYPDKAQSQLIDVYEAGLAALQTPYDVPQESGNHMATGWVEFKDGSATHGFRVSLGGIEHQKHLASGFSWAASPYDAHDVSEAAHPCDLVGKEQDAVLLRVDARVAGVGTAACGPGVRPDLMAKVEDLTFAFLMEPFWSGGRASP